MEIQQQIDYKRIETAIGFLQANFKRQPSLEEVAAYVHVSPFHFQRMFKDWAGVTPKQFLQYLSVDHAKNLLRKRQTSLFDAAHDTGLSGTGRLHDLFIKIEGMTPGEYKNGGEQISLNYSFAGSFFGPLIIASTAKGVCYIAFADDGESNALIQLKNQFPNANYTRFADQHQQNALNIFVGDWVSDNEIKLHLKGTSFQIKVWEALLKVPMGSLTTYSEVACKVNNQKASRAVGSAVADNPIAFLIPCHRVIRATGEIGQYHWGSARKNAIIGWEASKVFRGEQQE